MLKTKQPDCHHGDLFCSALVELAFTTVREAPAAPVAEDPLVTKATCSQHADDADECVYEHACIEVATNRLAFTAPDGDPRVGRGVYLRTRRCPSRGPP